MGPAWALAALLAGPPAQVAPAPERAHAQAVVKELSWARTAPREYAGFLRELRPLYDGKKLRLPGEVPILTEEGAAALEEAIAFLEKARPIGPLRWNEGLAMAARDHAEDQARTGGTGHLGSDGSRLQARLLRHGLPLETFGEVIAYGRDPARMTAISLLVDDGVPNRGHRTLIFNPDLHAAGAATATHPTYGAVTVVDLAGGFTEN